MYRSYTPVISRERVAVDRDTRPRRVMRNQWAMRWSCYNAHWTTCALREVLARASFKPRSYALSRDANQLVLFKYVSHTNREQRGIISRRGDLLLLLSQYIVHYVIHLCNTLFWAFTHISSPIVAVTFSTIMCPFRLILASKRCIKHLACNWTLLDWTESPAIARQSPTQLITSWFTTTVPMKLSFYAISTVDFP